MKGQLKEQQWISEDEDNLQEFLYNVKTFQKIQHGHIHWKDTFTNNKQRGKYVQNQGGKVKKDKTQGMNITSRRYLTKEVTAQIHRSANVI